MTSATGAQAQTDAGPTHDERIEELKEQIASVGQDDPSKSAYLRLQLVYAYQEAGDPAFARSKAKDLTELLSAPINEEVKAYIFYRVVDAHIGDEEYDRAFDVIDLYQDSATTETGALRRYAAARVFGKLYSALDYHERTLTVFEDILNTKEFFGLKEFQRDRIANNLNIAKEYTRINQFEAAYAAAQRAAAAQAEALNAGNYDKFVMNIVTLHVQSSLAEGLMNLGRFEEARAKIRETLASATSLNNDRIADRLKLLKARAAQAEGQSAAGLAIVNGLLERESGIADDTIEIDLYELRAELRESQGDVAGALDDRKFVMAQRSRSEQERSASRALFITAEIERQARQARLVALETENVKVTAEAQRSSLIAVLSVVAAILAFLALAGVYRAWRIQRIASHKLQQVNHTLQELSTENERLANTDPLTGIANRRRFIEEIDSNVYERKNSRKPFSIGILDLDGFKAVNDAYGHPAGDELLAQGAERLAKCIDSDVMVARLGGDEFGFICSDNRSDEELTHLGNAICNALSQPFNVASQSISIAASLGIAAYPAAGESRETLFEHADFALYHAKESGKGRSVLFSSQHEASIRRRAQLELGLRKADETREFDVEFQPIFDGAATKILGFEALARWNSPTMGPVPPEDFIQVAAAAGQMHKLSPVLLQKALIARHDMPEGTFLSFNLSPQEVISQDYVDSLVAIVHTAQVDPQLIVFELTETAMMRDAEKVICVLNYLRERGFRTALDDFGDGYSSVNHIARMPLDMLKIDRGCLENIGLHKEAGEAVLQSICDLSRTLNIETVIEGIETPEQLAIVQTAGIDMLQGFLLSQPVKDTDIPSLYDQGRARLTPAIP